MNIIAPTACLCLVAASSAFAQTPIYHITDLGTLGGQSSGLFISDSGLAAGTSSVPGTQNFHAVTFRAGVLTDLGVLPGDTQSVAMGVDAAGRVVGMSFSLTTLSSQAFVVSDGAMTSVGPFAARAVNARGDIVGYLSRSIDGSGWVDRACILPASAVLTELPTLGGANSIALGINNATPSWVVGQSFLTGDVLSHAALWIDGAVHDLGTLGGPRSGAYAANASGSVVGFADTAAGVPHAFRFLVNPAGVVISRTDLGVLAGNQSAAYCINDAGQVVGNSNARACLWDAAGVHDLNLMIAPGTAWVLESAQWISQNGRIIGRGSVLGFPHAFLLTPCAADFNYDGAVNSQDFFDFLTAFFAASPGADFNADQIVNSQDFFDFLSAFFVGCD